jgi:hypothetical protein
LRPGDFFGDALRVGEFAAEETAIAVGRCEVWSIEGRDFRALIEGRPGLAIDVIRALGTRVREMGRRVRGLTRKDVPARLAETLLSLWQQVGEVENGEQCLHGITQQDLADLVGASRSFVSTLINEMKRDGLLESRGRIMVLRNEEGLLARSNAAVLPAAFATSVFGHEKSAASLSAPPRSFVFESSRAKAQASAFFSSVFSAFSFFALGAFAALGSFALTSGFGAAAAAASASFFAAMPAEYFLLKRSMRPAVSISFCLPVKNGWQAEQMSRCSSVAVERVSQLLPQAQSTLVVG